MDGLSTRLSPPIPLQFTFAIEYWSYASNAIQVHLQILFVQATTQMNEKTLLTKLLRFCNWLLTEAVRLESNERPEGF